MTTPTASLYHAFRKLVKRGYKETHTKESRALLLEQIDTARKAYEESAAITRAERESLPDGFLAPRNSTDTVH
jgi:hypothetical protein